MQDVLIISPRFAPVNAADMHRVRLSLRHYRKNGWNPIVLAVAPTPSDEVDPDLDASVPSDIEIVRVAAWSEQNCRRFGFGQIDYRSFVPLLRAGADLIRQRRIKLVFFSTTVFLSFLLGPIWKRRFNCRLVYDIQDPWFHGASPPYTPENAPGSWRKYVLSQKIAGAIEPLVARRADHFICVSEGYAQMLRERYNLANDRFTVLPFPAAREDFEHVSSSKMRQSLVPTDGRRHWVYAGRGGPDMKFALSATFAGLAMLKREDPALASKLRLHFIGTNYAPSARTFKVVQPVAEEFGVADLVSETSERAPYFEVLATYQAADRVMLIGSDTADYTASKLFNCVLSGRPVLAVFHGGSLVASLARDLACVQLASFLETDDLASLAPRVAALMKEALTAPAPPCSEANLQPWLAEASTARQCAVFDKLVA